MRRSSPETTPRCARLQGFSLHADVAIPARRRDRLEHLCRSLLRPPLALDRLTETSGGQLLCEFRRPWADGSTALLFVHGSTDGHASVVPWGAPALGDIPLPRPLALH